MSNTKSTKRALLVSVAAMVLCLAMLIGTTFAWFTDSASTGVNTVVSGTLDVELVDENGNSVEGQKLTWKTYDNREQDKILWEPGCTYELQSFKIVNKGNLALKYKIEITGIDGDAGLNKVIDWTYKVDGAEVGDLSTEGNLVADATSGLITITGHMQETAGNEYQDKTIDSVSITVYATQYTYEHDSYDNQYDKDAEYATPVTSEAELTAAIAAGENVVLKNNIEVTKAISVPAGETVSIDLGGNNITATKGNTIEVAENATLTVTGTGTVDAQEHQKAAIVNNGGTVVLAGGTYTRSNEAGTSTTDNGGNSYYVLLNHGTMTIQEGVTVSANGKFSSLIENGWYNGNENTGGTESTLTIEGGTFTGGLNTIKNDDYGVLTINGGTFTNVAQHVVMNWNVATINGGTFTSEASYPVWNSYADATMDKGQLTINGGKFVYTADYGVFNKVGTGGGIVSITDGYFSSASVCNSPTFNTEVQPDGTYRVVSSTNP